MTAEQFEKITSGSKNCLQLVATTIIAGLFVVLALSTGCRQSVAKLLDDIGIESTEVAGLKLDRKLASGYKTLLTENLELKRKVAALNTSPNKQSETRDSPAPAAEAKVLANIDEQGSSWVYLGSFGDGKFLTSNFDVKAKPFPGTVITALTNVFKRSAKPYTVGKDDWRLGKIKGVVEKKEKVRVSQVTEHEGDNNTVNLWAEVTPVSDN